MYHHILIPLAFDFEGDGAVAIDVAKRLRADGGTINLLHVIEQVPSFVAASVPQSAMEQVRSEAAERMSAAAREIEGPVVTDLVIGRPAQSILSYAKDNNIDCIIMRSHQPELEDYLVGSTAAYVARHAACALHILR